MATAAARSICRSFPIRRAVANLAEDSRPSSASGSPFSASFRRRPSSSSSATTTARFLRSPVELSCCVESLLPMHSATASALMTSMLSFSVKGYVWLSEGKDDM